MTRAQKFILLILVGLASGSSFFIGNTLLKPSYVLPMIAIAYLPWDLVRNRLKYDRLALWIVLYIILASIYNIPGLVKDQLIDFAYVVSTFLIYIAAVLSAGLISRGDKFPAKAILGLIFGLFFLYLYQILTDSYLLPKPDNQELYSTTFNNSNDLNSFVVAFIPLALYSLRQLNPNKLLTTALFLGLAGWVIVLGSRFCILALFVIPLMFTVFSANYIRKIILFCLSGLSAILLGELDWEQILQSFATVESPIISRSASRLALFLFEFEDDKSSSYRMDSYIYAVNHVGDAIIGTGTKNYESFYQAGLGEGTLVAVVPHSYFIENMIAFGWLGLFLVVAMLIACVIPLLKDRVHLFYGLTTLIIFLMVSFVPSTVIRLPILWFPLFFFTYLSCQKHINFDWQNLLEQQLDSESGSRSQDLYEEAY